MKQGSPYQDAGVIRMPDGRDPATLYMTIAQVAAMRLCHENTVRIAIQTGRLAAWAFGGIYLIPRRDAEEWALRKPALGYDGRQKHLPNARLLRLQKSLSQRDFDRGNTAPRPYGRHSTPSYDGCNAPPPAGAGENGNTRRAALDSSPGNAPAGRAGGSPEDERA